MNKLSVTRILSFSALVCFFIAFYTTLTLIDLLPAGSPLTNHGIYILSFAGIAIGALLFPLFLPTPKQDKPLRKSIAAISFASLIFVFLLMAGVKTLISSLPVSVIFSLSCGGLFFPLCHGVFFLSQFCGPGQKTENITGRYCALLYALALAGGYLSRHFTMPVLESINNNSGDSVRLLSILFSVICLLLITAGGLCTICIVKIKSVQIRPAKIEKTEWKNILNLILLSIMFSIVNSVTDKRLFPFTLGYLTNTWVNHLSIIVITLVLFLCSYFAGYNVKRFLHRLLPAAIIVFILFPCLLLFRDYPTFNLLFFTFITIFHYSRHVIFTVAFIEFYKGSFWFYSLPVVIHFTHLFSFVDPILNLVVPSETNFSILIIILSAIVVLFLSFGLINPKLSLQTSVEQTPVNTPDTPFNLDEIFQKHGLSKREAEIAFLLLKEGASASKIGERLFISKHTVNDHIASIYQKFDVNKRSEFMALFLNKQSI